MSNQLNLVATKFENLDGDISYGFRIYDDYGKTYYNLDTEMVKDDLDLLQLVIDNPDNISETMLDYIQENESGILINNNWYDWDEIKDLF